MGKNKQLYEASQVMQARMKQLENEIYNIRNADIANKNSINPIIVNSAGYNIALRTADKIQAVGRYNTNIPELHLPTNRLEELFYEFGSLCFFRNNGKVLVATYAKTGELNGLGDLTEIQPIDFAGRTYDLKRTVVYTNDLVTNPCVIINDYTGCWTESQIIPRRAVNACSINDQAEVYRQMKNSVKLTAKKAIALIDDEAQREVAEQKLNDILNNDNPVVSLIGKSLNDVMKLHNLDTKLDIEGYLRAIESYERLRANFNGIKTRSSLDKKERLITSEAENDNVITDIYLYDGLLNRQIGIELMKKHGIITGGSCELSECLKPKQEENENEEDKDGKHDDRAKNSNTNV